MTLMPDLGESTYRGTGRLDGRKAPVTGGDSGIGVAVAIAFAREGADVAIVHLPDERTDAAHVLEVLKETGRTAVALEHDLADVSGIQTLVAEAVAGLGGLDLLVCNAGKQVAVDRVEDLSVEQFEETFRVNVVSAFALIRAAVPELPTGRTVILTASAEAHIPAPDRLDYAASKAAVNNLAKGLAQQLAPRGIRVNVVAPGPTRTALQVSKGISDEQMIAFDEENWIKRAAQPSEIAPAFVFLASAESSYVAAETLNINGGMPTP